MITKSMRTGAGWVREDCISLLSVEDMQEEIERIKPSLEILSPVDLGHRNIRVMIRMLEDEIKRR